VLLHKFWLQLKMQTPLEDEMAEVIIQASISEGDVIKVEYDESNQKLTTTILKEKDSASSDKKTEDKSEAERETKVEKENKQAKNSKN